MQLFTGPSQFPQVSGMANCINFYTVVSVGKMSDRLCVRRICIIMRAPVFNTRRNQAKFMECMLFPVHFYALNFCIPTHKIIIQIYVYLSIYISYIYLSISYVCFRYFLGVWGLFPCRGKRRDSGIPEPSPGPSPPPLCLYRRTL